jgi:predicted transcriptional regulator
MHRTTIMIPPELKRRASELARREEISFGELTRRVLKKAVAQSRQEGNGFDSLLTDRTTFRGKTPRDLAANHDSYLYGKE